VMQNQFAVPQEQESRTSSVEAQQSSGLSIIHEQYDLKGSTVNRHTETSDGSRRAEVALKDNDLKTKVKLGMVRKALLLEQVETDIKFLESNGICDYSFLLGIHFLTPDEHKWMQTQSVPSISHEMSGSGNFLRRDWGGLLSLDKTELYFMSIIDCFTTFNYKKVGEHLAKSLFNDAVSLWSSFSKQLMSVH